jgi:integrase
VSGEIIVPKSKTAAGTGRLIPLSRRACASLTLWLARFAQAGPESFLFPCHKMGLAGNKRTPVMYDLDLSRPMGSWRKAWIDALVVAKVQYRWHDLRHTFISRLAENPNTSEQTIQALAGHVSHRLQSGRSKDPRTSRFWSRLGTKMGTVPPTRKRVKTLTH